MSFALSFVPLKSTKMAQYKRFMEKPSFFTGQISTFAPDKTMFRKGLYGSEVLLDIFSLGFVPFLSRQTSTEKKQNMEVVDNKCVAKAKISKNAVTARTTHENRSNELYTYQEYQIRYSLSYQQIYQQNLYSHVYKE